MKEVEIILELTDRIRTLEAENKALKLRLSIAPLFDFKLKRIEKRMTMRDVQKKTGISTAYLSQLETGKFTNPSYKTVETLYNLYHE